MRAVEQCSSDPRERLLAMIDVLVDWFKKPEFSGCVFISASAVCAGPDHPIHATSAEHKRLLLGYIRERATVAGVSDPEELADELMLLMEPVPGPWCSALQVTTAST